MVNQFDFLPTVLDYLSMNDLEIAATPGKSYAAILIGKDCEWDDVAFFEFVTARVFRTPKWKYMKRFDTNEPDTLYDLEADPEETVNLMEDPTHRRVVEQLNERLTVFFDTFADPQYDLWKGGTAKGRLLEEHLWQR